MNIRLILKRSAQLLLVPMFALVVGCNEQDPDTISVGSVSATEGGDSISVLSVSADGGKYTVYPSTDSWSVVSSEEWCLPQRDKCESYSDDKSLELYIYSASHDTYGMEDGVLSRYATVTFTYGAANYTFLVSQGKADDYIVFYPDAATVGYEAATSYVSVLSSAETANLAINSSASWATATFENSSVKVEVAENPSEESREAVITVYIVVSGSAYSNPVSSTFTLTQEGRNPSYVSASISEYTFAAAAATYDVTLSSNISGVTYTASSSQPWCTPSISGETLTLTAEANTLTSSREAAIVTITAKSTDGTIVESATITVYQVGVDMPSISIGTTAYTYGAAAATSEAISFSAVGTVTAVVDADWVTGLAAMTTGLTFSLEANDSSAARTATITITATQGGESVSQTVTLTQEYEALALNVTPSVVEVYAAGEAITFTAATNGTATWIEPTATWISGGTGSYAVSENKTGVTRTCTIIVTATLGEQKITKELTVIQYATTYDE